MQDLSLEEEEFNFSSEFEIDSKVTLAYKVSGTRSLKLIEACLTILSLPFLKHYILIICFKAYFSLSNSFIGLDF